MAIRIEKHEGRPVADIDPETNVCRKCGKKGEADSYGDHALGAKELGIGPGNHCLAPIIRNGIVLNTRCNSYEGAAAAIHTPGHVNEQYPEYSYHEFQPADEIKKDYSEKVLYCRDWDVSFEGAVLATRERNMHDDSDFYAVVWDDEAGAIRDIEYATTRYATYGNTAQADATDEVKAKARKYLADWTYKQLLIDEARKAETVELGKTVRVVKGTKKIAAGVEAVVAWRGINQFDSAWTQRYGTRTYRIGLDVNGERVFLPEANVEVVDPQEEMPAAAEIRQRAEQFAAQGGYHLPVALGRGLAVL